MTTPAAQPDCTVVIPVFNRGEALDQGIESLWAQSIGMDRFEIVYVDDGSNDGKTPAMIDRIVAKTPNARVFHEPPSGSPGRPRNIGLSNARGEYVFFCDHDDWFDPRALERLLGWARQHDSDIVIGKVVAHGRRPVVPRLFRESRAQISATEAMISLTPHKLFRRAFLESHQIRYPEGKRRLEDHLFVAHAYLHAERISVYADRVCYHHNHPDGEENFSLSPGDPAMYVASSRDVITLIRRHTDRDPALRDALLERPVLHELVKKASPRLLRQSTAEDEARKHQSIRDALAEDVPRRVVDRLGAFPRATAKALRNGDFDAVQRIDEQALSLGLYAELCALRAAERSWDLEYSAGLQHRGEPVRFRRVLGRHRWRLDRTTMPPTDADGTERHDHLVNLDVEILVVNRRTSVQWHLPTTATTTVRRRGRRRLLTGDAGATLRIDGVATLDLERVVAEEIDVGLWDVVIRCDVLGVGLRSRLLVGSGAVGKRLPKAAALVGRDLSVAARVTPRGTFAIKVVPT